MCALQPKFSRMQCEGGGGGEASWITKYNTRMPLFSLHIMN